MQKFDYNIPTEFLTLPFEQQFFLSVEYVIEDAKVLLLNIEIPPPFFPYLKDMQRLSDSIYRAAENNAVNLELFKPKTTVDFMATIYEHFKMPENANT